MVSDSKKIVRARDVMHKGVASIDGMATAKEAAAKMRELGINDLLVEKRHPDDAWGIIVVQDLITGVILLEEGGELVGMISLSSLVLENELF
jgi:CBS domain-containing protein